MHRSVRAHAAFFLLLPIAACRGKEAPTAASSPSAAASVTSAASAAASAPGAGREAWVDLLHATRATIAVSSNVDNPRDYPDHLVDGDEKTAWNGRTGDLTKGYIRFHVPEDAHVAQLELSAGFNKIGKDGDLFTMNHRIQKVRVLHEGKVVREQALDVAIRTPQAIPIDGPGGTYEIQIVETAPGSKAAWKELCVSELRVLGVPGATRLDKPAKPIVTVGMLPHEYEKLSAKATAAAGVLGRTFPNVQAFCQAWDKVMDPILNARRAAGDLVIPDGHACRAKGPLVKNFQGNDEIRAVTKVLIFQENWSEERLAIETASGVVVPDGKPIDTEPFNDPGCFGANVVTIASATATGKSLEVRLTDAWKNDRTYVDDDGKVTIDSHQDDVATLALTCAPGGDRIACTRKELSRTCHVEADTVPCSSF